MNSSRSVRGTGPTEGAGSVKQPVLYSWDKGLMIPALPIWQTEELEMPSIFKL